MREASGMNPEGIPNKYLAFVHALDGGDRMYAWFRARPRAPEFALYRKMGGT